VDWLTGGKVGEFADLRSARWPSFKFAFFAEEDATKRDAIAAHQLNVLRDYQAPREKPLRLSDVKAMFEQMKGIAR
jgi:hypothetical protein